MLSSEVEPHRLSVADVYRMEEAGILGPEDRVELLDGVLVDMSPPGSAHSSVVARLNRHFVTATEAHEVRVQDMLLVQGGFVMPDLMVLEAPPPGQQPSTANLVVEVAVTTRRHDTAKAARYARAAVDEYWLIDVPRRTVRIHREPLDTGYRTVTSHGDRDAICAQVGGPDIAISTLLDLPTS